MILLEDVCFSYSQNLQPVFLGLNLEIKPFSWVTVVGPDGSGKSTLGKLIKGLLRPDSGLLRFDPEYLKGPDEVGYVGGDPYDFLVGVTVEDDIVFGLENLCLDPEIIGTRLDEALRRTGLEGMGTRLIEDLSGGEQQKVAVAGMLAMGMKVLILDECLAMLDRATRHAIRALLTALRRSSGLTILQIGNDWEDILASDRVLYLSSGHVELDEAPTDFLASLTGRRWGVLTGGIAALRIELTGRGVSRDLVERIFSSIDNRNKTISYPDIRQIS